MDVERRNILFALERSIAKLESLFSAQHHAVLIFDEEDEEPDSPTKEVLSQFLNVLECGLCHGIVCKRPPSQDTRSVFYLTAFSNTGNPTVNAVDPWAVICRATFPLARGRILIKDVQEIDGVQSGLGKARLWLRKALMCKNLSYLLRCLIECKDEECMLPKTPLEVSSWKENSEDPDSNRISRLYASGSLLTSSEGQQFVAALEKVDAMDFCFPVKENHARFDQPVRLSANAEIFYFTLLFNEVAGLYFSNTVRYPNR
ncbi:unnamed protein product [Schistocephalus solidus]|uniref:RUN domain-containing protein n=1 Tax=Schistocephalus solidus TaxID=70667 RepID=A0A183TNL0_SCHSO|nr:unnamed protein product [Schistocephalus solidus]